MSSSTSTLYGALVGSGIALVSGFGLEIVRSWQQRRASWREVQARTIAELQELLCDIKDYLAPSKPLSTGVPADHAPTTSDLEKLPSRTRARMLCSRLADNDFGNEISEFLVNLKDERAPWRTSPEAWLDDQGRFSSYANQLGQRMQAHKPWWVKA